MSLALGADAVWVGTRFVASLEGGAPKGHKELLFSPIFVRVRCRFGGLGGGFKHLLFSPLPGEMIQFD